MVCMVNGMLGTVLIPTANPTPLTRSAEVKRTRPASGEYLILLLSAALLLLVS